MSDQAISMDSLNVTSSPELAAGATHSGLLAGPMTDQSGQAHVLANLSPRQAREKGLLTSGIYGRASSISSSSADLSRCLANKLKPLCDRVGSTLYKMTWKESVTPSGRPLFRLAASGHRIPDNGSISSGRKKTWPTPAARDYRDVSTTRGYLAARKRHSPDAATVFLELGGSWKQIPQLYRVLMALPFGWHESWYMVMVTPLSRRKPRRS